MTAPQEPTDEMVDVAIDDVYEAQRNIATTLTAAGIIPGGSTTMGLLLLAAGNCQHARKPPMSIEDFLLAAATAYRLASGALVSHGPAAKT